jgi:hypothetical protein
LRDKIAVRQAIRKVLTDVADCKNLVYRKIYLAQAKKFGAEIGEPLDSVLDSAEMLLLEKTNNKGEGNV